MPLSKCMKEITHREYLLWIEFFSQEWNQPNRSDHYLMSIATEVRRVLSKKPNKIQLKHFILNFGGSEIKSSISKKAAATISKANWLGVVGKKIIRRVVGKDDG